MSRRSNSVPSIASSWTSAKEVLDAYAHGERKFFKADLPGANFEGVVLTGASFYGSNLTGANFSHANLTHVQLKGSNVSGANFVRAKLNATDLIGADFSHANLADADLTGAAFDRASLAEAKLVRTNLGGAQLSQSVLLGARLSNAHLYSTDLSDCDVSAFCDEPTLKHGGPSIIDARTVMRSIKHPRLKQFMIDCGVPEIFAEYMIDCARAVNNDLLRMLMDSTFISYGGPDEVFARKLYDALRAHGVVTYFFPETAKVGERINNEVFLQLQEHDRVLLVCSRDSLDRVGVVNEIQETLDREARNGGATYLLPIMLDDYVLTDWAKKQPILSERIGRRVIADFRDARRSKTKFDASLSRVLDALKKKRP